MKRPHLFVYGYGMGGVWGVMMANDADEIVTRYKFLQVVSERPSWMSDDMYQDFLHRRFDIDAEPTGWLLSAVNEQ